MLSALILLFLDISSALGVGILLGLSALLSGVAYLSAQYIAIRDQNHFLTRSLNTLPQGVFVLNGKNQLTFKNAAYEHFVDGLQNDSMNKSLVKMVSAVKEDGFVQKTINAQDANGHELSYQLTAVALLEDFSEFIFSISAHAPQVLPKGTQNLEMLSLMDKAPVGIFSINASGECLYMNKVAQEWLHCSTAKKINLFRVLDIADDRHTFFPDVEQINPGKIYEHYFAVKKQFYRVFQRFISNGKGEYVSCSVIFKSKRNRQSISLKQENFKAVFDDAPTGIVLLDDKQKILAVNQECAQMLGKQVADLVGRPFDGLLNFSCKQKMMDVIVKSLSQETSQKVAEVSFKGGKHDNLAAYIRPFLEDDRTLGSIIHFVSEAEQKKMEVQFVHSQRMQAVGQLAGGVAHDFNNLLTAMIGFCDLLLQRHSPSEQSFSDVMQIKQNANRAAGLVRQLLAFSRQQALQPQVINITDTLSELSALLRRLLGPAIDLEVKHARDLWFIKVDKGQFEQVIINLAVNARDAMENKGALKVITTNFLNKSAYAQNHDSMPPGEYVSIEIEDTGCGMSQDIMGRIFEPFFSTKAVGSGTGLGLSTVYGIIRQTGGFIFVDSAVGKGSTFRIFFPRHIPVREEKQHIEERALSDLTGTARILLVEDEDAVRMFAARALKDKGYDILEASNGIEAIEIAKQSDNTIDLIITDVVMPGMDGPQMVNTIREFLQDVKVVFISGYAEDSFRKKLNHEDNIHFLPKPFNLKDLALKVKDILN